MEVAAQEKFDVQQDQLIMTIPLRRRVCLAVLARTAKAVSQLPLSAKWQLMTTIHLQ